MNKFNKGDKVYVEAEYEHEAQGDNHIVSYRYSSGGKKMITVTPKRLHKAIPDDSKKFHGEWVSYNGEKWWCVGRNGGRLYLITSCDNIGKCMWANYCSEDEFEENMIRIVLEDTLSLWKEPQTATLSDGTVIELTDEEFNEFKKRG